MFRRPTTRGLNRRGTGVGLTENPGTALHRLWLRADSVASVGDGNSVATWIDKRGRYTFDATGSEGTFRASEAGINNQPAIEGGASTLFSSTASIDFSDTSQSHLFVVGKSGANAANKFYLEHGNNNDVGLWSLADETPRYQHKGNVGASAHVLTTANTSTAYHLLEGTSDKALTTTEAKIYIDGTIGDSRPGDANNTTLAMFNATLHLFARFDGATPLLGLIAEVIWVPEILTGAELASVDSYLSDRYGLTITRP